MLFLKDNAFFYTAQIAEAETANCGFELLPFIHLT